MSYVNLNLVRRKFLMQEKYFKLDEFLRVTWKDFLEWKANDRKASKSFIS